ncbi:MAG: cytochrome b/b6 domain-containing protein [Gammaproteobacteria bacterium]|nr:cytochrome b/b6 domain-containing protein [Gammaproteobacteria bacterium]
MSELRSYAVWDAGTRWFHWINVVCVIALGAVGFTILNAGDLDVSNAGKVTLKTVHVLIGYVFALNFLWRIAWAFMGNRYARWRSILPGGEGYFHAVRSYVAAFIAGHPEQYLGHNPVGRLGIAALFILISCLGITGLVLAGTDLFYPPIGHWIAQWVAAPGIDPGSLLPYAREMYSAAAYESMRAFRKPFAAIHLYSFYVLVVVVVVHIAAVVITELKEGGSIISAMFTGRKIVRGRPRDEDRNDHD